MSEEKNTNTGIIKQFEKDDLSSSSTKPLYFSKVTIEGDNALSPLSDSFYKAILENALTNPLQNIDSSLATFQDIKKNFLHTGLYQDVKISFEEDSDRASFDYLRGNVPREYGIELPIPTHAKVLLKPAACYSTNAATTTIGDDFAKFGFCRSWMNQLGYADTAMLYLGINYDSSKASWDGIKSKGNFSIPLAKNPSVRGLFDFAYDDLSDSNHVKQNKGIEKNYEYITSMGFQKSWILSQCSSIPTFYTGLSFTNRHVNGKEGLKEDGVSSSLKTGVVTQFLHDTRKFFGTLPVSGYLLQLNNEYVISQSGLDTADDTTDTNFNKFQLDFEHHASWFNNSLSRAFDLQFGGLLPMADGIIVDPLDKFYLNGSKSLKGFQSKPVGLGGDNFYYKVGLKTSHKLFNTPKNSPLRLQLFLNTGNTFNEVTDAFNSCAASTGTSLVYKTPQGDMDLTFAYPLTSRAEDVAKPGFSFNITFSYF